MFLRALKRKVKNNTPQGYPFTVGAVKSFESVYFDSCVTLITGDNGSGKTTFMELLSSKLSCSRISGSFDVKQDKLLAVKEASAYFNTEIVKRPKHLFFFQAEDFITYINELRNTKIEAKQRLSEIDIEYKDRSLYALNQAKLAYQSTLYDIESMYKNDLVMRSHGEGFMDFFASRLIDDGLYLIDEPESALSWENQLTLLYVIKDAVERGCQFIISTHSPVILSYPEAKIIEISDGSMYETTYNDLKQIRFLKTFLSNPSGYLR